VNENPRLPPCCETKGCERILYIYRNGAAVCSYHGNKRRICRVESCDVQLRPGTSSHFCGVHGDEMAAMYAQAKTQHGNDDQEERQHAPKRGARFYESPRMFMRTVRRIRRVHADDLPSQRSLQISGNAITRSIGMRIVTGFHMSGMRD